MTNRDALPSDASPLPWRAIEKGIIVDARGLHVAQASTGADAAFIVACCNAAAILASGQSGGQKHTTTVANSPGIPDSSTLASGQGVGQNGGQNSALLAVCEERRKHWKGVRERSTIGWVSDDASAREQTWGYVESLVSEMGGGE